MYVYNKEEEIKIEGFGSFKFLNEIVIVQFEIYRKRRCQHGARRSHWSRSATRSIGRLGYSVNARELIAGTQHNVSQ